MSDKRDRIHAIFEDLADGERDDVLQGIMRSEWAEGFMMHLRDTQVHKWQMATASDNNDERVRHLGGAEMIGDLITELISFAE